MRVDLPRTRMSSILARSGILVNPQMHMPAHWDLPMHPLTRVRYHRLRALGISALGAALLVLPGCLAWYLSGPVTVTVLDAESNAPIQGAQVDLHYSYVMCLNQPKDVSVETGSDGQAEIEEAAFESKAWKVSASGYIAQWPIFPEDGSPGNPREFRLYREPEPEVVVVIPTGYVGPILVDFIPSNTWIQDGPGSRRFRFDSSANGYVPIIASPLIRRATVVTRAEYRDGTPIARAGDASDHELAFRTVSHFGKDGDQWFCLIGTSADEQALLDRVAPRTNGTRHWNQAAEERLLSEYRRAGIVPAAR
jgi:hypothetical protein